MKTSVKGFARKKKYFEGGLIQREAGGGDCMFCSPPESHFISLISFAALSAPNDSQDYYKVPFFSSTVHCRHFVAAAFPGG